MVLLVFLTFLTGSYIARYGLQFDYFFIYYMVYLAFILVTFGDYIKKNTIQKNRRYNILVLLTFLIISAIFIRALFDKSLLSNNKDYLSKIGLISDDLVFNDGINYYNKFYVEQNLNFFILMLLGLFVYREINLLESTKKYNSISIFCLGITMFLFSNDFLRSNLIIFILFNIILLVIETWSLIKYNHKRKDWTVYVGWFFNVGAIIVSLFDW